MASTQDHISIDDIKDGIVVLKDGGAAVIIRASAVNFGLLSGDEQIAIIGSFAQMLNSLSFPIQITILSKKLDISAYIKLLDKAQALQTNPLLAQMMLRYRRFIQSLIKDNEVLDKQFYVTVPLSPLELGVGYKTREDKFMKAKTVLAPKRDQVVRQLNRVGLNATPLTDKEALELFYEIYNPPDIGPEGKKDGDDKKEGPEKPDGTKAEDTSSATPPPPATPAALEGDKGDAQSPAPIPAALASKAPTLTTLGGEPTPPSPASTQLPDADSLSATGRPKTNQPFVVEELPDTT